MPGARGGECLKRALDDALTSYVDPGPGGHLAVHCQAKTFQPVELVPVGPVADQIGVCNQNSGRVFVSAKDAYGFARLNKQSLAVFEITERLDDGMKRRPIASSSAGSSIYDQIFGFLRDVRIQVVHQHAEGGLLMPPLATEISASRASDVGHCAGSFAVASETTVAERI